VEDLITIELFGQCYTFKTESEVTRAEAVADSLVKEVIRIQEKESGLLSEMTKFTILVLAALNIANENYDLRLNHSELLSKMSERSTELLQLIDAGFKLKV